MDKKDYAVIAWERYRHGVDYKNSINYYSEVDENYRYFQGDQWGGVKSNGLPQPVFNIIKPVIRYKISTIKQDDTSILYTTDNVGAENFAELKEITDVLSAYAKNLQEKNKLDFLNECLLYDAAISGTGISYHYYDETKNEVVTELVDGTNIYPADCNTADIQSQEYIIIAFRRSLASVRNEASRFNKRGLNKLSKSDIEAIQGDRETNYLAGDDAKVEGRECERCTVLLMMWRDTETGTIHCTKSTRDFVIMEETDLQFSRYPIAMMNWELRKNCFFGISDAKSLIPNQDYVNTIAAMIMASTTFTSFPKMVYNADYIDNPNDEVGVAIGISGANMELNKLIDYISPGTMNTQVFSMFDKTITLTQQLQGANEGALGNINPENASGKAILAVQQQTAVPLDSIKRRYFNYYEDVALIWAEFWRVYTPEGTGKLVTTTDSDGSQSLYRIDRNAFNQLMLNVKIEVGPSSRWSELALTQTLENLLTNEKIDMEFFVDAIPSSSGFPKQQMKKYLEDMKIRQAEQEQMQMNNDADMQAEEMAGRQMPDIDSLLDGLSPEEQQRALEDKGYLQNIISQKMGMA